MSHVLVIAHETAASTQLLDAVRGGTEAGVDLVTVLAPVNAPSGGYVVYEDTRRAAAGRRLNRTLDALREAGFSAHGLVVDTSPVDSVKDALAQLEPRPDRIVVSTHPEEKSGWLRKNVVDRIREAAGDTPVEHVVVDLESEGGPKNVLVVANETVIGEPLLARIRERAQRGPASFLIIAPQSDATQAVQDERIDEIIVSTFAPSKSPWLRRDLIQRLHKATNLPVEHVVLQEEAVVT